MENSKLEDSDNTLTEDELKLYDRQIRLWGVEAQRRIREGRILIIGLNGLGAEIVKNIILTGVQAVYLADDQTASEDDFFSQFLIPRDKVGQNRAEASYDRAHALNPHVHLSTITDLSDVNGEFIASSKINVVVATGQNVEQITRLNDICRKADVKFFAGEVFGLFGYYFADLNLHDYTQEVTHLLGKGKKTTETCKKSIQFATFNEAYTHDFAENPTKLRRTDPAFFLFKILLRFKTEKNRNPTDSSSDEALLMDLRDKELAQLKEPPMRVPDELLKMIVGPPVGAVAATVGAVVSQEIVKALSRKDPPHNNLFVFNPDTLTGTVIKLKELTTVN